MQSFEHLIEYDQKWVFLDFYKTLLKLIKVKLSFYQFPSTSKQKLNKIIIF